MIGKADFLFNSLGLALQREIDSEGVCKEATTKTNSKLRCFKGLQLFQSSAFYSLPLSYFIFLIRED